MDQDKKFKVCCISDHPLACSGVSTQTGYFLQHLVDTGKYQIIYLAGGRGHKSHQPFKMENYGEDVVFIPVEGFGDPNTIRQIIDLEKPDCMWIMQDPRFYVWLFQMSDELKKTCPIVWYNIWDNSDSDTWPKYNSSYYDACTKLCAINKLTYNFLKEEGWADKVMYVPHAVPEEDFKILSKVEQKKLKASHLGDPKKKDNFVVFYNSRNALRKRTGTVMMAFKAFMESLPEEEWDKVTLCMKTPPKDPEGQDLFRIVDDIPNLKGRVAITDGKFPNERMGEFYNMADVTISMSSEEGFGLSILESLMSGTPVICTKTGGMQDQAIDPDTGEEFGFCLEPDARSLIGSQVTPYIWSDHLSHEKVARKLREMYDRFKEHGDHKEHWAGERARASALRRFGMKDMVESLEKAVLQAKAEFDKANASTHVRCVEV